MECRVLSLRRFVPASRGGPAAWCKRLGDICGSQNASCGGAPGRQAYREAGGVLIRRVAPGFRGCGKTRQKPQPLSPQGTHKVAGGNAPGRSSPGTADPEGVDASLFAAAYKHVTLSGSTFEPRRLPGALPPATDLRPFRAALIPSFSAASSPRQMPPSRGALVKLGH